MSQVVKVTIYSDGSTRVNAPDGIEVEINYAKSSNDSQCTCSCPIYRDGSGQWQHRGRPDQWGGDHPATPKSSS